MEIAEERKRWLKELGFSNITHLVASSTHFTLYAGHDQLVLDLSTS